MAQEWLPRVTSGVGPQGVTEANAVRAATSRLAAQSSA